MNAYTNEVNNKRKEREKKEWMAKNTDQQTNIYVLFAVCVFIIIYDERSNKLSTYSNNDDDDNGGSHGSHTKNMNAHLVYMFVYLLIS